MHFLPLALLFAASCAAGVMNTLAGGGSFLIFPALLLTGLDPRAANMTSTIALFPMQIGAGYACRGMAGGTANLSFRALAGISLGGGIVGALLLLYTPPVFFAHLVPWLILFATLLFAYSSFRKKPPSRKDRPAMGRAGTIASQIGISIYGGYFGGGIGFLMLAALTLAGMHLRKATASKNILAAVMNLAAVLIFLFAPDIGWVQVGIGMIGSLLGAAVGVRLLHRVNERALRIAVVVIGASLTVLMFIY